LLSSSSPSSPSFLGGAFGGWLAEVCGKKMQHMYVVRKRERERERESSV
jgi:hypothetical protein